MAESILSRIAAGDKAAVQECIEAYGKLIWALARRLSPGRADAKDAVQEAFIDLWRSAARSNSTTNRFARHTTRSSRCK